MRMTARLLDRGYVLLPIYVNTIDHRVTSPAWWDTLRSRMEDAPLELYVSIQSTRHPSVWHAVAIEIEPGGCVQVSDSLQG